MIAFAEAGLHHQNRLSADRQASSRNSLQGRALALRLCLEDALPRRPCCKRVEEMPGVNYFKPRAVVEGCALRIEGGSFRLIGRERCERCSAKAALVAGQPSPCLECPVKASLEDNVP